MRASEFLKEDMSRRGFLGVLGAGALAASGVNAKAPATQYAPVKQEPINVLSMNTNAEILLQRAARAAGIKGIELAQFLAQCSHESADFSRMKEMGGTQYFTKKYDPKFNPVKARTLGNTNPGDGARYAGRGYIQITGRENYRRAGQALNLPLEQQPELAAKPDVAARIAVWYWKTRVKPNVQNFADTTQVTKYINPGLRGLQDRHSNFLDYKKIIT